MIALDRLVLDVPGIDRDAAGRLADEIGTLLARADIGSRDRLDIVLPPGASDEHAVLAAVAAAIRARTV